MTMMRTMAVVFRKEIVDGRRDRRSIWSLLFSAALAPVLFGVLFTVAAERRKSAEEITLPVAGIEYAPAFVGWLKQQTGVQVMPAPADAERAVRERDEDVVLIIEKDFEKDMARAVPAPVKLVSDVTREGSRPKVNRVRNLVATYSQMTGGLRLIARGVAPSVATAVRIEEIEVSSSQQRLAMQLNVLPLLLVIAALTGGMQIAIDSTAGERERGSLEPLLLNPGRLAFRMWRRGVLHAADDQCHAARTMARPRHPVYGYRRCAPEPARPGAAGRAPAERGRPLRVDLCEIVQGSTELPEHADAVAHAAGHRVHDVPAVEPALAGSGSDSRTVRAGGRRAGGQAAARRVLRHRGGIRDQLRIGAREPHRAIAPSRVDRVRPMTSKG